MTNKSNKCDVLVLDGDMVPALCVARSLRQHGLTVDVASHLEKPIASYSRCVRTTMVCPNPMEDEAKFITWLRDTLAENNYSLVVPVTERTVVPLSRADRAIFSAQLAMADNDSLNLALDKRQTVDLALRLGVSVPRSVAIANDAELDSALDKFVFPTVVKPSRSVGTRASTMQQLGIDYAFNNNELLAKAKHALKYGEVLLQEYCHGYGVGIELIADRGQIKYAFQHRRLHEVPLTGGGSSLRKSVPIQPELLAASAALIKAMNWHGVAMVEFKWNPARNEYRLMEVNGRLWGSLPLAVAAGANFPVMLYDLFVNNRIAPEPPPARTNILCRKLSSDVSWYEAVLRRDAPPALVTFPTRKELFKDLLSILSPRHFFDVQQIADPLPGLVDIWTMVGKYTERFSRLMADRKIARHQVNAWRRGRVTAKLGSAKNILFVCYGNINRSALAERYLSIHCTNKTVTIRSAGFHREAGRPADPVMIEVCGEHDLDMRNWSSRSLNKELVDAADIILVMEVAQVKRITQDYPAASDRTFLLGLATTGVDTYTDIADPFGLAKASYEQCFREVVACCRKVLSIIPVTHN